MTLPVSDFRLVTDLPPVQDQRPDRRCSQYGYFGPLTDFRFAEQPEAGSGADQLTRGEPDDPNLLRDMKKLAVFTVVGAVLGLMIGGVSGDRLPWYDHVVIGAAFGAFLSWLPSDGA